MYFVCFQAFLAVKSKVMPHQALSKKKAIVLLCFGWAYGFCMALMCMFMPHAYQMYDCTSLYALFHKVPMTMYALSVMSLSALVIILQLTTYWKLWKQWRMAVGSVAENRGRNRIYHRAMITSCLIAACFVIGWLPSSISLLLFHWSNIDKKTLDTTFNVLSTLGLLQSLCNPIIFKIRNSNMEFRLWRRCLN